MEGIPINLSLVKYSEIEKTHYFYDPAYPGTIQFIVNGQWESYDVSWVKDSAHDPEVGRIAREAYEANLRRTQETESRATSQSQSPGRSISGTDSVIDDIDNITINDDNSTVGGREGSPAGSIYSPSTIAPSSPGCSSRPYHSRQTSYATPFTPRGEPYVFLPEGSHPPERHQPPLFYPEGPHDAAAAAWRPDYDAARPGPPPGPHVPGYDAPREGWPIVLNRDAKIVLSLDGDGIRGLSAVLLVEALVDAICKRMNRRLDPHQIFDLIGGCSTTGLLAIMIGRLRMRLNEARQAYVSISRSIFMDKIKFFASLDRNIVMPPYNGLSLEQNIQELVYTRCGTLDETFFDNREDSTNVFVISTKVDIGYNQPAIVRSYPTRRQAGPEVPLNLTVTQAIHATLHAPHYVDPHGGTDRRAVIAPGLVDLGTAKNNPVRDIYYECRKLYSYTNDTMVIISIGTGGGVHRREELKEMSNSVMDRTYESRTVADKFEGDHRHLIEQGWMKYYRFNVGGLDGLPLEEGLAQQQVMERTTEYLAVGEVTDRFYKAVNSVVGVLLGDVSAW